MGYKVIQGNNIDTLKSYPDNYFDSVVTDPPYGISFLGKDWDSFRNSKVSKSSTVKNLGSGMRMTTKEENINFQLWCEEWAKECFRVLKPGGYMLSFCAARMYHRMTVGLEDAGFEIRDQIMWIYSSGFPKSQDVGRSIQRSIGVEEYEDMVDTTKNAGFGMTDHARVRAGEEWSTPAKQVGKAKVTDPIAQQWEGWGTALKPAHEPIALARKPLKQSIAKNVQQWGVGALNIDAARIVRDDETKFPSNVIGEILQGNYQKYFYCPKVSRRERHTGFELPEPMFGNVQGAYDPATGERYAVSFDAADHKGNNHPTVKPIELMKYLIKLVTPQGGKVLDPFCGSGSTGCAAVELGYEFVGCELDPAYVNIALTRISAWNTQHNPLPEEFFNE